MKSKLEYLLNINAISSFENEVSNYIKLNNERELDILNDRLGSVAFNDKHTGPKLAIIAHMDEVGFLVKQITSAGQLIVIPIGAIREYAKNMHSVTITNRLNQTYTGVLNITTDLYVDLGLDSREEVLELGIDIGDMVTYDTKYSELNENRYIGKALDNRLGCLVNMELMNKSIKSKYDLYYAYTVQEEVGMRGAKTLMNVINPDYAIIVDVACARDELNTGMYNTRKIGNGPSILYYDKNMLPNKNMLYKFEQVASKYNIPFQKDMFVNGGTDGGLVHLHNDGIPTIVISIPNRYGHGPYSIGDYSDIENTVKLLEKIISEVDFNEA